LKHWLTVTNTKMKTVKVEFNEQSKGYTAHIKIESTEVLISSDDAHAMLKEAEELFIKSITKTKNWSRGK